MSRPCTRFRRFIETSAAPSFHISGNGSVTLRGRGPSQVMPTGSCLISKWRGYRRRAGPCTDQEASDYDAGRSQVGRQSRTQRPQLQPLRLLQCQPGPQPSAIGSASCAMPISNRVGLARIGRVSANKVTKAIKSRIIAAIKRIASPRRDAEAAVGHRQRTEPNAGPACEPSRRTDKANVPARFTGSGEG